MVCVQSIKRGCPTRSLGSGQSWSMVKLNLAQGNPGYTGNGKRKNPGKSVQRKAPPGRKCSGTTTKKARQTQTSLGVIKREKGPPLRHLSGLILSGSAGIVIRTTVQTVLVAALGQQGPRTAASSCRCGRRRLESLGLSYRTE